MLSPLEFIPIAEETGLIVPIGEWVLRTACREAAGWPRPYKIAVNLSAKQFQGHDLAEVVHRILLETGLSPSRLELEITETALFDDLQKALDALRRLRALGVSIAMDDFGTGYSSLSSLQAFPFDKIKIDRQFVEQLKRQEASRDDRAISTRPGKKPGDSGPGRRRGDRRPARISQRRGLRTKFRAFTSAGRPRRSTSVTSWKRASPKWKSLRSSSPTGRTPRSPRSQKLGANRADRVLGSPERCAKKARDRNPAPSLLVASLLVARSQAFADAKRWRRAPARP